MTERLETSEWMQSNPHHLILRILVEDEAPLGTHNHINPYGLLTCSEASHRLLYVILMFSSLLRLFVFRQTDWAVTHASTGPGKGVFGHQSLSLQVLSPHQFSTISNSNNPHGPKTGQFSDPLARLSPWPLSYFLPGDLLSQLFTVP